MCTTGALLKGAAREAVLLRSLSGTTHCAADCSEYRQAAGAIAERVARVLEWVRKVLFMGRPFIRNSHFTFCIAAAICTYWLTSACCQEAAKRPKLNTEVERCRRINNEHMRTRCLEEINSKTAPVPRQQPTASGTWQLARTPNPSGGRDSISITKIVNPTPSEE